MYDRRVRQLDEMCDLLDALEALERGPYDGTMRAELDRQGVGGAVNMQGIIAWQSDKARGLITRAGRYWCDPEVENELCRLGDIRDRSTEVSAGIDRHAVVPDETPWWRRWARNQAKAEESGGDASSEYSPLRWTRDMVASAELCVYHARRALNEDGPPWWRRWVGAGIAAASVASIVLVVL